MSKSNRPSCAPQREPAPAPVVVALDDDLFDLSGYPPQPAPGVRLLGHDASAVVVAERLTAGPELHYRCDLDGRCRPWTVSAAGGACPSRIDSDDVPAAVRDVAALAVAGLDGGGPDAWVYADLPFGSEGQLGRSTHDREFTAAEFAAEAARVSARLRAIVDAFARLEAAGFTATVCAYGVEFHHPDIRSVAALRRRLRQLRLERSAFAVHFDGEGDLFDRHGYADSLAAAG